MVELTNTQLAVRRSLLQNLGEDPMQQQQQQTQFPIINTTTSVKEETKLKLVSETNQQELQQELLETAIEFNRLTSIKGDQHNLSIDADSVTTTTTTTSSNSSDYQSAAATTTTTTGHPFLSTSSSINYISDTTASENHQKYSSLTASSSFIVRDLNETELDFELFNSSLNDLTSESKLNSETAEKISTPAVVATSACSENIKLSQQEHTGGDSNLSSADQSSSKRHLEERKNFHSSPSIGESISEITNTINNKSGYQLRALNENISAWETNPWFRAPTLPNNTNVSALSTELVNETLNYFVNCGQRLSQMTKTYDDNDAYILLLQEKEVDLELAARIGQDLLRQNQELKESIRNLEEELAKRQGDVQQLKHELASKISLLDTFIEEEEHQTSLAENEDDPSTLRQHDLLNYNNNRPGTSNSQQQKYLSSLPPTPDNNNDDDNDNEGGPSGFLSLNFNHPKPDNSFVEPFSSLPPYYPVTTGGRSGEQHQQVLLHGANDSSSTISEDLNPTCSKAQEQQKLVQSVTLQLVESNRRLCELQDELFYKSEQNLLQQEKIYNLKEQLNETDRRLVDLASENESFQKSILESTESQRELSDELKICKRNFSDLLGVFLELQKESRIFRNTTMLQNSNPNYIGEIEPVNDMSNISFDSFNNKRKSFDGQANNQHASSAPPPAEKSHAIDTTATTNTYATTTNNYTARLDLGEFSSKTKGNININSNNTGRIKKDKPRSLSLLDELQETMQRTGLGGVRVNLAASSSSSDGDEEGECDSVDGHSDDFGDATDGGDSGVHTNHNATSSSTTPSANGLADHNDSGDDPCTVAEQETSGGGSGGNKTWVGLSTFMLTTLLLLCLSVTFTSNSNFQLAPKLKLKLDR